MSFSYLGALTTTFSASQGSCTQTYLATNEAAGTGWLVRGADDDSSKPCEPTGFTRNPPYYYSPGVCPLNSIYACWGTTTSNDVATTIATCCPSSFVCFPDRGSNIYGCASIYSATEVMTISSIYYHLVTMTDGSVSPTIISSSITKTVLPGETLNAYGVIVRRQAGDPSWFSSGAANTPTSSSDPSRASSSSTSSSTAATTGDNGDGASRSQASTSDGGNLSAGTKAGIAVGAAAGVLLGVAIGFFLFRMWQRNGEKRRQKQLLMQQGPQNWQGTDPPVSQTDGGYFAPDYKPSSRIRTQEAPTSAAREMDTTPPRRFELQ